MKTFQGSNPCFSKKIFISILSINIFNLKKNIFELIISNFNNYHVDVMDYSYVKNNSYSKKQYINIKYFLNKLNIKKIEFHIMSKYIYIEKNSYYHFENFNNNIIALTTNFCFNYIKKIKFKKKLLMAVNPGFGNQTFRKNILKYIFINNNIDGGIKKNIFFIIKNYFNKIIVGSNIINNNIYNSFFKYNFIYNEYIV